MIYIESKQAKNKHILIELWSHSSTMKLKILRSDNISLK